MHTLSVKPSTLYGLQIAGGDSFLATDRAARVVGAATNDSAGYQLGKCNSSPLRQRASRVRQGNGHVRPAGLCGKRNVLYRGCMSANKSAISGCT